MKYVYILIREIRFGQLTNCSTAQSAFYFDMECHPCKIIQRQTLNSLQTHTLPNRHAGETTTGTNERTRPIKKQTKPTNENTGILPTDQSACYANDKGGGGRGVAKCRKASMRNHWVVRATIIIYSMYIFVDLVVYMTYIPIRYIAEVTLTVRVWYAWVVSYTGYGQFVSGTWQAPIAASTSR